MEDRFASVRAQAEYATAWIPTEVGEEVYGKVIERDENVTVNESTCPFVLVLENSSGKASVWGWHTVLQKQLANVAVGDLIAIRYLGKKAKLDGNGEYAAYKIAVERADEEPPGLTDEADAIEGAQDRDGIPY